MAWDGDIMGVHLYKNSDWIDSGRIYRNSINMLNCNYTGNVGTQLVIACVSGSSTFTLNKGLTDSDTSANIPLNVALSAGTYTLSVYGLNNVTADYDRIFLRDTNNIIYAQTTKTGLPKSFTIESDITIDRVTVVAEKTSIYTDDTIRIMINNGNAALPYEPYNVVDWYANNGHGYSSGAWS